jgi:hypothetical protein
MEGFPPGFDQFSPLGGPTVAAEAGEQVNRMVTHAVLVWEGVHGRLNALLGSFEMFGFPQEPGFSEQSVLVGLWFFDRHFGAFFQERFRAFEVTTQERFLCPEYLGLHDAPGIVEIGRELGAPIGVEGSHFDVIDVDANHGEKSSAGSLTARSAQRLECHEGFFCPDFGGVEVEHAVLDVRLRGIGLGSSQAISHLFELATRFES